ncbi:MAG: FtsH protease activity modulator HflK [Lysobacteraceae bacterium]|nr:MAG: FtsH protease activity modulator HflK [Xanthomonadaceae bacterium]
MAWNIPGGSGKDGRNPQRRGGGGPLDRLLDPLRGLFGGSAGSGGPGPGRWIAILLALWLVFNSFVLVTEQQRGVVLRFGQVARVLQPGPHLKWPWPIERVIKVQATQIKTFSDTVPVLTRDENIVTVEVNVQYRVDDAILYLFGTRNAEEVLTQATLSAVREQVGRSDLDTVLSARNALSVSARERLQESLREYRTGLLVTELNLPNARPPEEVKPAFDDVNSAQQDKDRLKNEAEAYASKIVPEARGHAARVRTVAEGYKEASIARATGDSERFSLLREQYEAAPGVTRKRLWLETVEDVLRGNRTVVGADGRELIYLPMPGTAPAAPATTTAPLLAPEMVAPPVDASPSTPRPGRDPRPAGREELGR